MRLILSMLLCCAAGVAQPSEQLQSMLQRIFNSSEFTGGGGGGRGGREGGVGRWSEDGKSYTTIERGEIVRYDPATARREVVVTAAQLTPKGGQPLAISNPEWSADGKKLLVMTGSHRVLIRKPAGAYWMLDRATGSLRQLGGGKEANLLFAKLSPDGTRAAYVRGTNLFVEDLGSGAIRQLTSDGTNMILNGVSDWVYDEEFSLADGFRWSPDSQRIAYWQFDQSGVPEYALVNYTDSLYPTIFKYPYPKAGHTNSAVRIGVVSVKGGPTRWMKAPGDPRNQYIPRMEWAGNEVIFEHMNRLQNTNDVLLANPDTGDIRRMLRDRDEAWVNVNELTRWIENGSRLIFTSERDGWRHIYAASKTGDMRLVTNFSGDVISVAQVDAAGGWLYFIASPDDPVRRYLYGSRLDGTGRPERLTPASSPGSHTYNVSPNGEWAFHTYSAIDRPPVSDLVRLPKHETVRVINDNAELTKKAADLLSGRIEFVKADAGDGVSIDGWVMKPRNFDPSKKYPVVVYVYGEPAGATATDTWGSTRALFHAALSDDGYLVASFDNSGTPSPKGRAWRKSIYGSVGVLASKQQAAALRSLAAQKPWVDLSRAGVWGWSGGGSMTDNLMFRSPELYRVGVSVAAVPDQALYDSIYQERYMGLPIENAKGYHDGSPISFAEGLKGKLLILHGTGDDNVHFQGNQKLINRLVELGKQFDFMEYPNRTHGISEGRGTTLHVYSLIARYFETHLPAGGR